MKTSEQRSLLKAELSRQAGTVVVSPSHHLVRRRLTSAVVSAGISLISILFPEDGVASNDLHNTEYYDSFPVYVWVYAKHLEPDIDKCLNSQNKNVPDTSGQFHSCYEPVEAHSAFSYKENSSEVDALHVGCDGLTGTEGGTVEEGLMYCEILMPDDRRKSRVIEIIPTKGSDSDWDDYEILYKENVVIHTADPPAGLVLNFAYIKDTHFDKSNYEIEFEAIESLERLFVDELSELEKNRRRKHRLISRYSQEVYIDDVRRIHGEEFLLGPGPHIIQYKNEKGNCVSYVSIPKNAGGFDIESKRATTIIYKINLDRSSPPTGYGIAKCIQPLS